VSISAGGGSSGGSSAGCSLQPELNSLGGVDNSRWQLSLDVLNELQSKPSAIP